MFSNSAFAASPRRSTSPTPQTAWRNSILSQNQNRWRSRTVSQSTPIFFLDPVVVVAAVVAVAVAIAVIAIAVAAKVA